MINWQPTATFSALKKRAEIIQQIRVFFRDRNILEVDTPLLSHATVTDPHVVGIPAIFKKNNAPEQTVYLQTSPEYAMKRLLAFGSGSIFQICKAFRQGDLGRIHNPEFTMLEWYRIGFDHHDLMNEMDELLQTILKTFPAERVTYAKLFEKFLGVDPHTASRQELIQCAADHHIQIAFKQETAECDMLLALLFTHCIEPKIAEERPLFLYDFPISQAALAKIRYEEIPPVASRFEVYFKGHELANGFHELQNSTEQRKRFENDLLVRKKNNILDDVPLDENFLAALDAGLPECAGVALGIDRLVMIALNANCINEVMSFDFDNA
ncbi:MAG TPA: elongation factor P--(R)-beta-lysine ligase [Gammaproteobacteria bacterium]|nr:elongation factor P--(R)-beta-lysine ligase [Gammaproteobacteria bacterium]